MITKELECRSVERVRPRLGDDVNHGAGITAVLGEVRRSPDINFLNRTERRDGAGVAHSG